MIRAMDSEVLLADEWRWNTVRDGRPACRTPYLPWFIEEAFQGGHQVPALLPSPRHDLHRALASPHVMTG